MKIVVRGVVKIVVRSVVKIVVKNRPVRAPADLFTTIYTTDR